MKFGLLTLDCTPGVRQFRLEQVRMLLTAINQGEIFKFITKPWRLE